jgi:hypothetical protein
MFDTVRLRQLVRAMLCGLDTAGLSNGSIDERLLPSASVAAEVGGFDANQARLREILAAAIPPLPVS